MKTIMILTLGFILGLCSAGAVVASGYAPYIVGGDGYLMGVEVVDDDGDVVCSDPFYWKGLRQIECD